MILADAIKVLKAGQTLKNPATWKKGQQLTNCVGGLVMGAVGVIKWKFPEVEIPDVVADYAIQMIAGGLVVINAYITPATTEKINVMGKEVQNG